MIKYFHILLLSLATLGVVVGSFQTAQAVVVEQSTSEFSDYHEGGHSIFFFLFENDNSEEQNDSEDSSDLDPLEEENKKSIEIDSIRSFFFTGLSITQIKSNLVVLLSQVQPTKRFLLFQCFKIYC